MEEFSKAQYEDASKFAEFYTDLVENRKSLMKYYLAKNIVLDWFGRTVKTAKNVDSFICDNLEGVLHMLPKPKPNSNIAFRNTHLVPITRRKSKDSSSPNTSPVCQSTIEGEGSTDETNNIEASTSNNAQSDYDHCTIFDSPPRKIRMRPRNKNRSKDSPEKLEMKYVTSEGALEFSKTSSKKLRNKTKWQRPCRLHIGYTSNYFKNYTIYLIIYEGNLKCKRQLFKEFPSA